MAPWMSPGYWSPNMRSLEEQLQQELEGHRKTWRQLEHVNGLLREIRRHNSSGLTKDMQNRIDAALSQQAEQKPEVRQIKKPPFGLPYGTSGKEVP